MLETDRERSSLLIEEKELENDTSEKAVQRLMKVYERLEKIGAY